jgi:hypothetical protein
MELNERFKLLSNYNVKNTLTENVVSILNEDAFTKAAREGALVAKELEGALKSMKADSNIAKELETLKAGGVQTADDLLSILKLNKLSDYKINLYELSKLKYNLDDIVIQMVQCLREKINPRLRVLNK